MEKLFDKIQYCFMTKTLSKLGIETNLLKLICNPYKKVTATAQQVKNQPANAGDTSCILGFERFPGGGHGNQLQYFCLENPMDWGASCTTVHGVTKKSDKTEQLTYTSLYFMVDKLKIFPHKARHKSRVYSDITLQHCTRSSS